MDEHHQPQFQMMEGHLVEDGFCLWTLTLREEPRFHDGEPVLARDVIASLRCWGAKDMFGATLMEPWKNWPWCRTACCASA